MNQEKTIEQIQNLPFFFILGRPRSGTTLLRTLLDAHPNVIIPLENSGLMHLYFKYRRVHRWDNTRLESLFSDIKNLTRIESWNLDWEGVRKNIDELHPGSISFQTIIKILYYNFRSGFEKTEIQSLGDKTPLISLYAREMFALFPEARFIHLIRDYRANLASMSKYNVFTPSVTGKLMQWKKSVCQINRLAESHPQNYMQVRYEDLVTRPEEIFKQVCAFLEIIHIPDLLDAAHRKKVIETIYNTDFIREWQPNLSGNISTDNIDKWKDELSPESVRKADYIAGKTGLRFFYKPVHKDFDLLFILKMETKKLLFHLNECNRYFYDRLPYRIKLIIKNRKFKFTDNLIKLYQKRFEKG
jgi:hypothetical protein